MNRFILAIAFASLALPAHAQAPAVSPDVVMVRIAGPWQSAGQRGVSRFIATSGNGTVALSVEWISDAGQIVQTLALESVPGSEQVPLSRVRNTQDGVTFDTAQGDTFVLAVGAPGDAKFGPASH